MISVVIPVYDGADVLPTTVPAVAALRGVGEVVYVDDGSRDATAGLLAEAAGDHLVLRVVTLPKNAGRAAARNAGVAATTGDVLVFFDADVEPAPGAAAALAEAASVAGAVAAVARLAPVVTDPEEPYQDYVAHHPRGPSLETRPGDPLDWRFFVTGACAVRREAFLDVGGFSEDVGYGEDLALACRLAGRSPHGLRLAGVAVRHHDLGDLGRAVGHAEAFGRSVAHFQDDCRHGPLRDLRRLRPLGRVVAPVIPVLRAVARRARPGPIRRKAVRYLLASAALRATSSRA